MTAPNLQAGRVVAAYGRHVVVESPQGARTLCHPRGKKTTCVVGDMVEWLPSADEGTIENVLPRRNLFYRQDEIRTKSFAANLDQVLIVLGAEPEFSERQLARALVAAEAADIRPLIVLNKRDLTEPFSRAWERLTPYRQMGYTVLPLSLQRTGPDATLAEHATQDLQALDEHLRGHHTLILGPSGVGKSTLINHWIPDARAATGEISRALNAGKHTTTSTAWYWVDAARHTALIDSPGFQEFGLHHIAAPELAGLMPDLRAHLGHCKYHNCSHQHEPGCQVISAIKDGFTAGFICEIRYKIYCELYQELNAPKRW